MSSFPSPNVTELFDLIGLQIVECDQLTSSVKLKFDPLCGNNCDGICNGLKLDFELIEDSFDIELLDRVMAGAYFLRLSDLELQNIGIQNVGRNFYYLHESMNGTTDIALSDELLATGEIHDGFVIPIPWHANRQGVTVPRVSNNVLEDWFLRFRNTGSIKRGYCHNLKPLP